MPRYTFPAPPARLETLPRTVYLVANGDLRLSANVQGWPVQQQLEADVTRAIESRGWSVVRGHDVDESAGHGFIDSQRRGLEVFRALPRDAPLLVVEAVWQYSHHLLAGLRSHRGPIMAVANWNGTYPGLVGLLNLTASLTKAGVDHSVLWSVDFTDQWALDGLQTWLDTGKLVHPTDHVRALPSLDGAAEEVALGRALAQQLLDDKHHRPALRRTRCGDLRCRGPATSLKRRGCSPAGRCRAGPDTRACSPSHRRRRNRRGSCAWSRGRACRRRPSRPSRPTNPGSDAGSART